jgi:hypothetical protein
MVPSNILQRVFNIKIGNSSGTCFAIDVSGKQYFITAKHVVTDAETQGICFLHNNQWNSVNIKMLERHIDADIAVFAIPQLLSNPISIVGTSGGNYFLSQDVYFIGFPFGFYMDIGINNSSFPLPYVKKAIISAFDIASPGKSIIYLDGINNRGFSGGPVCYIDTEGIPQIISVISSYKFIRHNVLDDKNQDTNYIYTENTGIIDTYSIKYALELIESNPSGYEIQNTL